VTSLVIASHAMSKSLALLVALLISDLMTSRAESTKPPSDGGSGNNVDAAASTDGRKLVDLNDVLAVLESLHEVKNMLDVFRGELNGIQQQQNVMRDGLKTMSQRLSPSNEDSDRGQYQDLESSAQNGNTSCPISVTVCCIESWVRFQGSIKYSRFKIALVLMMLTFNSQGTS